MKKEINKFQTLEEFKQRFKDLENKYRFNVKEIPWKDFDQWSYSGNQDRLEHRSGKFFKIEGLRVKTKDKQWDQPIINQPEIGILGIITKVFDNVRYYLMQAKMEPGNLNTIQLSPTVQATKSNFEKVHKGNAPAYLEYFLDRSKGEILIDLLLSEQGGKFLKKRNRNMVVEVFDDIEVLDDFFWLTLSDIKELLKKDNFLNMDARSVISTIPMHMLHDNGVHSIKELFTWLNDQKVYNELHTERIPLSELNDWKIDDFSIHNVKNPNRFFSVIGVKVEAITREVTSWTQPMIKDTSPGFIGFLRRKINGVDHYLVQAKVLPGNIDIIDISPTVSISNYDYVISQPTWPPYLSVFTELLETPKTVYDTLQSEEGGRFFHYQNRNVIIEIDNGVLEIPNNYKWITYDQLMLLMGMGYINIETRSLLSSI